MQATKSGEMFTELTLSIFKLSGLLTGEGDEMTREYGITSSRWKILGAISLSPGPVTVPQISRAMGQSRQAVQRLVDVMVKDDLLRLRDNPNHKRARYVELAARGEDIYQRLYIKQIPWAEACSADLDPEELATTLRVVQQISLNLASD